jgi:hypothetical protein
MEAALELSPKDSIRPHTYHHLFVSGVFSTLRKKHEERRSPRTAYRRNAAWLMTVSRTLASP